MLDKASASRLVAQLCSWHIVAFPAAIESVEEAFEEVILNVPVDIHEDLTGHTIRGTLLYLVRH
jgi:hypothetical protein